MQYKVIPHSGYVIGLSHDLEYSCSAKCRVQFWYHITYIPGADNEIATLGQSHSSFSTRHDGGPERLDNLLSTIGHSLPCCAQHFR